MDQSANPPSPTNQKPSDPDLVKLSQKLNQATLPPELATKAQQMISRLSRMSKSSHYTREYETTSNYLSWITSLPWNKRVQKPIDIAKIKQVLDQHHYGMQNVKDRIIEYMSVLKLRLSNNQGIASAPIIFLVGLVGTGKTTFAYALSEALGRPLARIPFGGLGSAKDLRGQSRLHLESEPGYVIKALSQTQAKNSIILLDEIDRVTERTRDDVMGVLVELLDKEQNSRFIDHYIDYPVDLSEVLFIATGNNTTNVATAVQDRLEPIRMPSYTDQEKIHIAQDYLLPKIIKQAGITDQQLVVSDQLWPKIVRHLGYDAGIRTLKRSLQGIARKTARLIVEGNTQSVKITSQNLSKFLPQN